MYPMFWFSKEALGMKTAAPLRFSDMIVLTLIYMEFLFDGFKAFSWIFCMQIFYFITDCSLYFDLDPIRAKVSPCVAENPPCRNI